MPLLSSHLLAMKQPMLHSIDLYPTSPHILSYEFAWCFFLARNDRPYVC